MVEDSKTEPELEAKTARPRPWASLVFPQFDILLGTSLLGAIGHQMRQVIFLWIVYDITGSTLQTGLVGLFQLIPLALSPIAGTLADTLSLKKLMAASLVGQAAIVGALAAAALSDNLAVWHVYVATMAAAAVGIVDQPARMSAVYSLVPRTHLMNAITVNAIARQGANILGPAIGGVIIGWYGWPAALAVTAAMFVPGIFGLMLLQLPPKAPTRGRPTPGYLLEGLRFLWSSHFILALIVVDISASMFTTYKAVMPAFAEDIFMVGPKGLGLLLAAPGVGWFGGSMVLLALGNVERKGMMMLISFLGYSGTIAAFAIAPNFWTAMVAISAVGALDGIGSVTRQATLQLMVPDEIRGRATATLSMFNRGAPSAGYLLTGAVAEAMGARGALFAGSMLGILVASVVFLRWQEVLRFKA